ncbi:MAG: Na/Pi symporter, partial [Chitinophagaceae bacterium]
MPVSFDIWKMLAGISIFLLGMHFMETGLQRLAGRPFKLFLRKQTSNKLKAVAGGAIVTGLLQSSSMVNLMVLAFVGTGVIQMQNALAVILGANLGTTLSSWLIATVGFQFNIESFAFPMAGIFGITMMLTNTESRWHQWSKFLLGLGFLFLGLNFIKTGIEAAVIGVDLSSLNRYPTIIFFLMGLLITSLIQSSSATVAIALSALHVNAIGLLAAMAIVLGSEIGTTFKLVLASIKGIAAKKRVALGNLLFNISTAVIIFIFLIPINRLITEIIGINNNLVALVFFQSLVNITGIILFFPFLNMFGRFLEKRFLKSANETMFIHKVKINDADLALTSLEKETQYFIYHLASFSLDAFDKESGERLPLYKNFESSSLMEKYDYIKEL